MLYNAIILLVIFIFSLGQVSLAGGIFPSGTFPDLLLVLVIFWVAYFGRERKMIWILMAGFFLDLAMGGPLGKNIFLLTFCAYATSYISSKLLLSGEAGKFFLTMAFVAVGTLINEIAGRIITIFMLNDSFELTLLAGGEVFLKIFFNLAFFLLIYFPVIKLEKAFFTQKEDIKL
ncbi:rod shape-determining protein MreD [Patescibacteria group bacterium]|nr:rod shape-determining protein MreD [Patescibacteria group bacterium]